MLSRDCFELIRRLAFASVHVVAMLVRRCRVGERRRGYQSLIKGDNPGLRSNILVLVRDMMGADSFAPEEVSFQRLLFT